jgi:hypothetical protein
MLHNYPAGYPTRAREDVDARELVEVGTIEVLTCQLEITARANELILASDWSLADPAVRFANACSTAPLPWLASQQADVPAQAAPEN